LAAGLCYSTAMKGADLVRDEERLEHFIADPDELVPGNSMKPHGGRRVDALSALRDAALAGLGLALLPCYVGGSAAALRRFTPKALVEPRSALWLLTHNDLKAHHPHPRHARFLAPRHSRLRASSWRGNVSMPRLRARVHSGKKLKYVLCRTEDMRGWRLW
jgi:DNA-binding transcriptional LysR family regulator